MVLIIDYGVGNVGSIRKVLRKGGADVEVAGTAEALARADRIILPGVGAFDDAMQRLHATGLVSLLQQRVLEDRIPVLGICLGMQMLTRGSHEGERPGFGWLEAESRRFDFPADTGPRVPHIGWSGVKARDDMLFGGVSAEDRFYFLHSFYVHCDEEADIAATSHYGGRFTCAVRKGNIFGVQFHPEKSQSAGLRLLTNFARI